MAIALTSIGATVSYGSSKSDTFTKIPGITEIPEMNPTPDMLDTTSLDNLVYTTGTPGLKSLDVLAFGARFSQDLMTLMDTITTASSGVIPEIYLQINIRGLTKSCFVKVVPVPLGLPAVSTNSAIDCTLYFTPVGEPEWDTPKSPG